MDKNVSVKQDKESMEFAKTAEMAKFMMLKISDAAEDAKNSKSSMERTVSVKMATT